MEGTGQRVSKVYIYSATSLALSVEIVHLQRRRNTEQRDEPDGA